MEELILTALDEIIKMLKEIRMNSISSDGHILKDSTSVIIETDEENPTTIVTITPEEIDVTEGYRVRIKPKY